MSLTNRYENEILNWLFKPEFSINRPTSVWVSLHTESPSEQNGAYGEVTTDTDPDYARKQITFEASGQYYDGQCQSNSAVSWIASASSANYTVTHIAFHTDSDPENGNPILYGALVVPKQMAANKILTFNAGDIIVSLD